MIYVFIITLVVGTMVLFRSVVKAWAEKDVSPRTLGAAAGGAFLLIFTVIGASVAQARVLCIGNIPAKIEHHLNEDLRFCVYKTSEEYNKCISETSLLFVKMYHRYKPCFEVVDEWSSGGYSDGTWAQFKFKVRFRGMYYSSTTTQLKKIPDEAFAARIKEALRERKYQ